MSELGDKLTQELGPLPVWAWGAIGGGALLAAQWWSRRGGYSPAPSPAAVAPDPMTGTGAMSPAGAYLSYSQPSEGTASASTNEDWVKEAIRGSRTPAADAAALTRYLNGDPLTWAQLQIVEAAIARFGPPPDLPGPGPDLPTRPAAPRPAAPRPPTPPARPPVTPRPRPPARPPAKKPPKKKAPTIPRMPTQRAIRGGYNRWRVVYLQRWLNENASANLAVDGIYGPKTIAALARFQKFFGISGEQGGRTVGPQTWRTIALVNIEKTGKAYPNL